MRSAFRAATSAEYRLCCVLKTREAKRRRRRRRQQRSVICVPFASLMTLKCPSRSLRRMTGADVRWCHCINHSSACGFCDKLPAKRTLRRRRAAVTVERKYQQKASPVAAHTSLNVWLSVGLWDFGPAPTAAAAAAVHEITRMTANSCRFFVPSDQSGVRNVCERDQPIKTREPNAFPIGVARRKEMSYIRRSWPPCGPRDRLQRFRSDVVAQRVQSHRCRHIPERDRS